MKPTVKTEFGAEEASRVVKNPKNDGAQPPEIGFVSTKLSEPCDCSGCNIDFKEAPCPRKLLRWEDQLVEEDNAMPQDTEEEPADEEVYSRSGSRRRILRHQFSSETKDSLKKLYRPDNYHGLVAVAVNIAILVLAIGVTKTLASISLLLGIVFYPLAVVIIGSRFRALATLVHDAGHRSLARNKVLEAAIGHILAFAIFQRMPPYCRSHNSGHHGHFAESGDPDHQFYSEIGLYEVDSLRAWKLKYIVGPLFGSLIYRSLKYLVQNRLFPDRNKDGSFRLTKNYLLFIAGWLIVIGSVSAHGLLGAFFLFWLVPFLTSFQVLSYWIELSEHFPRAESSNDELELSRNRFGNFWERTLTAMHGEAYHLTHHLDSRIPFYRQKQGHEIMMGDSEYCKVQERAGGIFTKCNPHARTVLEELLEFAEKKALRK